MRALILLLIVTLTACEGTRLPGVFKIDIKQGNIVTQEMLEELQPGMTPQQVQFVLGTPVIRDVMNPDRWDYLYSFKAGNEDTYRQQQITVFFGNGLYSHHEGTPLAEFLTEEEKSKNLKDSVDQKARELEK